MPERRVYIEKNMALTEATRPYRAWDRCGWKPPLSKEKDRSSWEAADRTWSQRPEVQRFEPERSKTKGGFNCHQVKLLYTNENHLLVFVNRCCYLSLCPEVLVSPSGDKSQSLQVTPQAQSWLRTYDLSIQPVCVGPASRDCTSDIEWMPYHTVFNYRGTLCGITKLWVLDWSKDNRFYSGPQMSSDYVNLFVILSWP